MEASLLGQVLGKSMLRHVVPLLERMNILIVCARKYVQTMAFRKSVGGCSETCHVDL